MEELCSGEHKDSCKLFQYNAYFNSFHGNRSVFNLILKYMEMVNNLLSFLCVTGKIVMRFIWEQYYCGFFNLIFGVFWDVDN